MHTHLHPFQSFIDRAISVVRHDAETLGLAVGGSWASGEMDAWSDLDLVLVTTRPIAPDISQMRSYAARLGTLLTSFRGDHVGEPRLLIALYDSPLLHVDVKFLTLSEFHERVENPVILWERDQLLTTVIQQSSAQYPAFDFQGIDDRFWVWMYYALLKIGRGEYFEALDFLSFVRSTVLGPLLHLKNGGLPRSVRRIETSVDARDLTRLRKTVAMPDRDSLIDSLSETMRLYEDLLDRLAPDSLQKNSAAQRAVEHYFAAIHEQTTSSIQPD